jgi:hypothetical protein
MNRLSLIRSTLVLLGLSLFLTLAMPFTRLGDNPAYADIRNEGKK